MKLSTIFKLTKGKLWDGQVPKTGSPYICDTIKHLISVHRMDIPTEDAARARKTVQRLLDDFSLQDWLAKRGVITIEERNELRRGSDHMAGNELMVKLQATRHAWLNHLIAHHKAIGD